jgi:hypothetical protein
VVVIELFALSFFSASSARDPWKSVFSLAVVLQPPVEIIFSLAVFKQTASVNDILTDGFIKQTVSVNTLSTIGFLYLAASGSFPHFFQFFKQN